MENSVYVASDENGGVITVSQNNPEYGWVTLRQDQILINNGWVQNKSLSTIVMGRVADLEAMNLAEGEVLDGQIIVREQTEPFTSADRDVKVAGATGIVCSVGGNPIYRKTFYTLDTNQKSVFVQHDNAEEIRAALQSTSPKAVTPSANTQEELADVFEM